MLAMANATKVFRLRRGDRAVLESWTCSRTAERSGAWSTAPVLSWLPRTD